MSNFKWIDDVADFLLDPAPHYTLSYPVRYVGGVNLRKAIQDAQNVSGPDVLRPTNRDLACARIKYAAQLDEFYEQFSVKGDQSAGLWNRRDHRICAESGVGFPQFDREPTLADLRAFHTLLHERQERRSNSIGPDGFARVDLKHFLNTKDY